MLRGPAHLRARRCAGPSFSDLEVRILSNGVELISNMLPKSTPESHFAFVYWIIVAVNEETGNMRLISLQEVEQARDLHCQTR